MKAVKMYRRLHRCITAASRRLLALMVLISLFGTLQVNLQAQMLNEDALKANYLVGFVDFLHWDREEKNTIVIGLFGDSNLEREIENLITKKKAGGSNRNFEVFILSDSAESLEQVDVLFLAEGTQTNWETVIPRARELGILTVGDATGFLDSGGLIEFVIKKNRLRFALNLEASEEYRIGLSSKLARLAVKH